MMLTKPASLGASVDVLRDPHAATNCNTVDNTIIKVKSSEEPESDTVLHNGIHVNAMIKVTCLGGPATIGVIIVKTVVGIMLAITIAKCAAVKAETQIITMDVPWSKHGNGRTETKKTIPSKGVEKLHSTDQMVNKHVIASLLPILVQDVHRDKIGVLKINVHKHNNSPHTNEKVVVVMGL